MDLATMIEQCAPSVAPTTMTQVLRVESAFRPHVIGTKITKNGQVFRLIYQPSDKAQAISWAGWLIEHGYRFDAGMAQINSSNFARLGLTTDYLFDECASIGAGARVLTEFYQKAVRQFGPNQSALHAAISAYQTGSFTRGFDTGYVQRVAGPTASNPTVAIKLTATETSVSPRNAPTTVGFNGLDHLR